MHIFLSPHLDDVVLSCGATIARLVGQGEQVVILTAMAGEPPETLPDTPLVRALRDQTDGVKRAVVTRRQEDAQAAMCLGVKIFHLSVLASTFRCVPSVDGPFPLYPDEQSQVGDVHPSDDARVALLSMPLPFTGHISCIYAPLGAGNHVDHQLVRDWGLVLGGAQNAPALRLYGELPYVQNKTALDQALAHFTSSVTYLKLRHELVPLTNEHLHAKLTALRCYVSRVHSGWETAVDVDHLAREWTGEGVTPPAEQFWLAIKGTGALSDPL